MDFLIRLKATLTLDEMALFTLFTWSIWFSRNKWVHCNETIKADTTISWVNNFYQDFNTTSQIIQHQNSHKLDIHQPSCSSQKYQRYHTWILPPPNRFKLNVDAAIDASKNAFGLGLICRNHHGEVMMAAALFREGRPFVVEAEAFAILESTNLALEQGLHQIELESDSLSAISQIRSLDLAISGVGLIISDILDLIASFGHISFSYVSRKCIFLAHDLAKYGLSSRANCFWMEESPSFIQLDVIEPNST